MASPVRHIVILLLWYDTWFFVHDFIKHFNGKFSWCCKIVRACGADRSVCLSVKSQPPTGFLESKKTLSEFFFSFCFGFQQILDEFTSLCQVCHRQYSLKKKIYFFATQRAAITKSGLKNMKQLVYCCLQKCCPNQKIRPDIPWHLACTPGIDLRKPMEKYLVAFYLQIGLKQQFFDLWIVPGLQ